MKSAIILGSGYTGKYLAELGRQKKYAEEIFETSRSSRFIRFELQRAETWRNLPSADIAFWTFPALPLEDVRAFLNKTKDRIKKIVVIGSTSAFKTTAEDAEVSEQTPLHLSDLRVRGEEEIRSRGGIVVRAAGIYGPGRNPIDWLKSGRVKSFQKFVNFIHVEDLAGILWAAAFSGTAGDSFIASDNRPFRWSELVTAWKLPATKADESGVQISSKRVNSLASLEALKIQLKYKNVLDGVLNLKEKN